jgi:hypothetical protein
MKTFLKKAKKTISSSVEKVKSGFKSMHENGSEKIVRLRKEAEEKLKK